MRRWLFLFGWLCLSGGIFSCSEEAGTDGGDTAVAFTFSGIGTDLSEGAPSTRGEKLPVGTTVRVVAYKGASYVADHTYKADASGNLIADAGEMRLIEGTYDFYAVSPALNIASKGSSGPTFSVAQGVDFASVKKSYKVTAYTGSNSSARCTVPLGELARKCAKLTFNIEPDAGLPIKPTSLKVMGIKLTAMPSSLTATGATLSAGSGSSTVSVPSTAFSSSGTKCTGSIVALPKTRGTFALGLDIQFNGSGITVTFPPFTLAAMSFDAGKQHVFTIKLMKDRVGVWATTSSIWTDNNQTQELGGIYLGGSSSSIWTDNSQTQELGAIDLSANGTANCYIVTKAGTYYSFDATVMGNGATTPQYMEGGTHQIVPAIVPTRLAPASVAVLWETMNTVTAPAVGAIVSDVKLVGDRVTFKSGTAQGNAVIAVKNSSGTILWSWHIWRVNGQPKEFPLAAIGSVTTNGELVLMDRNLGALSATAQDNLSTGLHYQWGRKDPFPAYAGLTSPNNVAMLTTPSGIPVIPGSTVQYSVAQSIQRPTTFFKNSGDWCSSWLDHLWGTPYAGSVSIKGNDYNLDKGMKSIYDPCPPGWRVPPAYAFANAVKGSLVFNKGYSLPIGQSGAPGWFPAAGYRDNSLGVLNAVASHGNCWTSSPKVGSLALGSKLYFYNITVYPSDSYNRAFGISCRCCKE